MKNLVLIIAVVALFSSCTELDLMDQEYSLMDVTGEMSNNDFGICQNQIDGFMKDTFAIDDKSIKDIRYLQKAVNYTFFGDGTYIVNRYAQWGKWMIPINDSGKFTKTKHKHYFNNDNKRDFSQMWEHGCIVSWNHNSGEWQIIVMAKNGDWADILYQTDTLKEW